MSTIPSNEPESITAGDTLKFTKAVDNYSPDDSWVLSYALVMPGNQINFTASDNGDGTFLVNVAAATTANWQVGQYQWQAYVTKTTERYQVAYGLIEVKPDFATETKGYDARQAAERELERIDTELAKIRASDSRSIKDRQISDRAVEDLLTLRDYWKREVVRIRREEKLAAGMKTGQIVLTRFSA